MDVLTLSQWQFAVTSIYHFFFVPLTLGLSVLVAIIETIYVRTGNPIYKRMAKFWGTLFLINFAMGVVTGIVQEFQFGMNWSEYSRFVGDIFGVPLAIEALMAFFLESTFLGVWIFGWDKLSKGLHAACIWLVAIGSNLSALWILIANSFMQNPQGFMIENGRAVMTDFAALLTNPNVWVQFPHTVLSGFTTGAFFMMGISAYHLLRRKNEDVFQPSFQIANIFGAISILLVILVGHNQAQYMVKSQPMKMAAAEALVRSQDPAPLSLLSIVDQNTLEERVSLRIPVLLSVLSYNQFTGEVKGIVELQEEFSKKFGPGNYIPNITINYWAFRIMVGAGFLMFFLAILGLYLLMRKVPFDRTRLARIFPLAIALPYFANSFGWILTEMGRQPWVVYGIKKTADAFSPNLTAGMVLTSLILFILIYGALMAADVYLLVKYAKAGPASAHGASEDAVDKAYWA